MVYIPKHTQILKPYKSGKPISELAREKGLDRIVKLASNENPLGPSPLALAALNKVVDSLHRYVDPKATELVEKLATMTGLYPDQIVFGHGTDSLLAYIVNAFTCEEDEVLTSAGTFIGIYVNVNKLGRRLTSVPLKDYSYDLEAIADAVTDKTRIIYLANPNNPTGTMFTAGQFEAFMERVPDRVLVLLDEAYYAYGLEIPDYPDGLSYQRNNLIVSRTMSKVYGLAGLRVGYAVGPAPLVEAIYKVKLPFEPNALAQAAAMAALDDETFLAETLKLNRQSLDLLREAFDRLELPYVATAANFYLLLLPDEKTALAFYEECLSRGLIVRPVNSFGIPNGIRINSGTIDETTFAISVVEHVCRELKLSGAKSVTR